MVGGAINHVLKSFYTWFDELDSFVPKEKDVDVFEKIKDMIVRFDGTGCQGFKKRGTNVFKLYETIDIHGYEDDTKIPKQIAFYEAGVAVNLYNEKNDG